MQLRVRKQFQRGGARRNSPKQKITAASDKYPRHEGKFWTDEWNLDKCKQSDGGVT